MAVPEFRGVKVGVGDVKRRKASLEIYVEACIGGTTIGGIVTLQKNERGMYDIHGESPRDWCCQVLIDAANSTRIPCVVLSAISTAAWACADEFCRREKDGLGHNENSNRFFP